MNKNDKNNQDVWIPSTEETQNINWNSTAHGKKIKFIIPVGNLSREEAEKQIKELMKSYKEEIQIDDNFFINTNPLEGKQLNVLNKTFKRLLSKFPTKF